MEVSLFDNQLPAFSYCVIMVAAVVFILYKCLFSGKQTALVADDKSVKSVGGKSLIPLPGFIRTRLFWAIEEAERLKGSPPNTAEVSAVIQMNFTTWIAQGYICAFIQNLYREDKIYADR